MEKISVCKVCKKEKLISYRLKVCIDCIRENKENILQEILEVHHISRKEFSHVPSVPKNKGRVCKICSNNCSIEEGKTGFCGLRKNVSGKIVSLGGVQDRGILDWYFDPLPTNCVASWICDGSKQFGMKNLAVFYRSCSFNCLFCQNWHFKETEIERAKTTSAKELSDCVDSKTFCICYFGGDPSVQIPHALAVSKIINKKNKNIRICWETNGNMNQNLLKLAIKISLESGGCIKFDLKAYNENLHYALCGVSNKQTLKNFEFVGKFIDKRKGSPLLVASTLVVPGYIDSDEIFSIANFIAKVDRSIPYSLLGFYPHFYLDDLPVTTKKHMKECTDAARSAGLSNIHIGNIHLLS